ncbi:hypothetical protein OH77DRAFT_1417912 [Trametes cingulata]|nr:hypothetical protein OH77DRAFT_1417912 [Trametes cingulata]
MSSIRPIIHGVECSYCRQLKPKESIKMCGGCKVMGYCSKECQKADWKEHKPICRQTSGGNPAPSRIPSIKVAEKILADDDVMCRIDGILIKALDLEHHPERADTHAVMLSCRVESTDTKMATERLMHLMSGREPPPLPEKIPKLFQIGKVGLLPNDGVPETLNLTGQRVKDLLRADGHLKPGSGQMVVRAMWVSEECEWAACYFARLITPEMIQEASTWKKPVKDGEPPSDEPTTTADLIKLFDVGALMVPEMKKKLTIMVSTKN